MLAGHEGRATTMDITAEAFQFWGNGKMEMESPFFHSLVAGNQQVLFSTGLEFEMGLESSSLRGLGFRV